jgi:hypothetical protein
MMAVYQNETELGLVSDSKNGVGPDSRTSRTSRSDSPTLSDEGNF